MLTTGKVAKAEPEAARTARDTAKRAWTLRLSAPSE
jgi:hypothetical protein